MKLHVQKATVISPFSEFGLGPGQKLERTFLLLVALCMTLSILSDV